MFENILKLKELLALRPKYEWEVSNTYPISKLHEWGLVDKAKQELALNDIPNIPAKVYAHIPFCQNLNGQKCRYCFYNTCINRSNYLKRQYIDHLERETDLLLAKINKPQVESFYFGGGTPTALSANLLEDLFDFYTEKFQFASQHYSWTVEVSPLTVNETKLKLFKRFGVNRISMGVQDLNNAVLQSIGRNHDKSQAVQAIEMLKKYGFFFNIDLIYGLAKQNIDKTLRQIVDLEVPEITLYRLRSNPDANLARPISFEQELRIFHESGKFLEDNGYIRVRPIHWVRQEYYEAWKGYGSAPTSDQRVKSLNQGLVLGFGASAISQVGDYLWCNHYDLSEYYKNIRNPVHKGYQLTFRDKTARLLISQLVQKMKMDLSLLNNLDDKYKEKIDKLLEWKLLAKGEWLRLTEDGLLIFDLIEKFFIA